MSENAKMFVASLIFLAGIGGFLAYMFAIHDIGYVLVFFLAMGILALAGH